MDSNNNRLYLNFGNNERQPTNDRAYPTTPSTFPQPVFPPASAGQQQAGGIPPPQQQQQQQQQNYAPGYAPQGYFSQGQYPPQGASNDYAAGNNPAAYQPRSNTPGTNDPNTGLAHQFSHQNLGGARSAQYSTRGAPPVQRPRTAGATGQPTAYSSYPPMPAPSSAPVAEFQAIPERNPDRYGSNANSNQKKCSQLAADFFKDSVKRARERNQRCVRVDGCVRLPFSIINR